MSTEIPSSSSDMPRSEYPSPRFDTIRADDDDTRRNLKYLDFVQTAMIYLVVLFTSLYEYAKENSGPLKPGVQTVEDTVKTVIGPVYDKFHDVPFELLKFIDQKVNDSVHEVDHLVPSLLKQATNHARAVASEIHRAGILDTVRDSVADVAHRYEPVAEQYAVSTWRGLNKLPLFPQVAQIMVPAAVYWADKYNEVVQRTSERGYAVSCLLPSIPTDRIAKVFEGAEDGSVASTSGHSD